MNSTEKDNLYYIHSDYLGNYETITDEQGQVADKLSFDPCSVKLGFREPCEPETVVEPIPAALAHREGRRRNPTDWTYNNVPQTHLFDRGFTGHEHLDNFDLINMNGRVYDPWLGRFLSPDPFVQAPTYSQNFNRYSYALNNPLKYTDPSGEIYIADDAVFGLIGGGINVLTNLDNIHSFGQGLAYFGVGFVSGAVSEYISPVGSAALVGAGNAALTSYYSTGSVDGDAVIQGAVTSAAFSIVTMGLSSTISPYVNKMASNITSSPVLQESITQGIVGTGVGAVGGGVMSAANSGNFWEGAGQGALWGGGIGFATGAYSGYQIAKARGLNPWTGEDLMPVHSMEQRGIEYFNSYYEDPSNIVLPKIVSHYTSYDPSEWRSIGTISDKTIYLTYNKELGRVAATNDLSLQKVPNFRIDIPTSNIDVSKIIIIRRVNGNVFGQGGGRWKILYKGPLNFNPNEVVITPLGR